MAEFTEVMRQRERMCQRYGCCGIEHLSDNCPLYGVDSIGCKLYMYLYPEKCEDIVMKWAEENQAKTNSQKFKEVFGFYPESANCPSSCSDTCTSEKCIMYRFWNKKYED